MTKETVIEKVKRQRPRLIYLSGKTCTGKTTFADHLEHYGYKKVELDKVVLDSIVTPFNVAPGDAFRTAYRDEGPKEQTAAFIKAAKNKILNELEKSSLIIEGAVAQPRILGEIFSDHLKDFVFIYFHPIDAEAYEDRILRRFMAGAKNGSAGLPKGFWELVQKSDLEEFKNTEKLNPGIRKAIKLYAERSMEESQSRLKSFQEAFKDIAIIEV